MFRTGIVRKIIYSAVILISLFIQQTVYAQQDFILYNMQAVPQRMYDNPAFRPSDSAIFIGLPVLSSQYLSLSNSGFKYSDLIKHDPTNDSLYADVNNMLSKLAKQNYISFDYHVDILSFGFPVEKNYFSFSVTEKIDFRLSYSQAFMNFIWNGNGAYLGQAINLSPGIDFTHYRDYGLGWSREISDKLTIGIKLNYLYGMENVSTVNPDVSIYTDPNNFDITAQSSLLINTAGVNSNSFDNFNIGNYLFKKNNNGASIDFGVSYKPNDRLTFSASVVDLGFITWNNGVTNYESNNPGASFTYQGINLNDIIDNSSFQLGNELQTIGDSVEKIFKIDTLHHSYSTMLATQMYLSANYNITKKSNVALLFYGQLFDNTIYPGVTLSYNQQLGRWLTASASYSIYNRSYNNIGLGLSLNAGAFQFYIVSDNALGILYPQNTQNLMIHFGFNLTFRHKKPVLKQPSTFTN
jgi:hypothetical protein